MTIKTAKMNGLDPQAYFADVLARINDHMINRLDELLPWNWTRSPPHKPKPPDGNRHTGLRP
jgi:transposase